MNTNKNYYKSLSSLEANLVIKNLYPSIDLPPFCIRIDKEPANNTLFPIVSNISDELYASRELTKTIFKNSKYQLSSPILEIQQLNKNISSKIISYIEVSENIINQYTPEFIFLDLIYVIRKGLLFIENNFNFLSIKIRKLSDFILNLKNLIIIFKNIYDNIRKYKKNKENFYLSTISTEGMSFYDFQKIEYIKYSKINLSNDERNDLINIITELQTFRLIR